MDNTPKGLFTNMALTLRVANPCATGGGGKSCYLFFLDNVLMNRMVSEGHL